MPAMFIGITNRPLLPHPDTTNTSLLVGSTSHGAEWQ
jgi:hypothetical protein